MFGILGLIWLETYGKSGEIHDADSSDTSVLVLQDRHRSHLVDTEQVRNLLISNYY